MSIQGLGTTRVYPAGEKFVRKDGSAHGVSEPINFNFSEQSEKSVPMHNVSRMQIDSVADKLIKEQEEKDKSWLRKGWDILCSVFSNTKTKMEAKVLTPVEQKAKNIHANLMAQLKAKGVDFDSLSFAEKKEYLSILLQFNFAISTATVFVEQLNNLQKKRTANEAKNAWPKPLQDLKNFVKTHFCKFFSDVGKMNVAAVDTAVKYSPAEIAEQLKLVYTESAASNRKELLKTALKELPKDLDQEAIIEFCIASERMSKEELAFAKDLLDTMNLSPEEKARRMQVLLKRENELREESIAMARYAFSTLKKTAYKYVTFRLEDYEADLAHIYQKEEYIKQRQKKLKAEYDKKLSEFELEKKRYELLKAKKDTMQINRMQLSPQMLREFNESENKYKKLDEFLYDTNSKMNLNTSELKMLDQQETVCMQGIDNNLRYISAYSAVGLK